MSTLPPKSNEPQKPRRRLTVREMLAVGAEIAAMPLLDPRSPHEIMDDVNFRCCPEADHKS